MVCMILKQIRWISPNSCWCVQAVKVFTRLWGLSFNLEYSSLTFASNFFIQIASLWIASFSLLASYISFLQIMTLVFSVFEKLLIHQNSELELLVRTAYLLINIFSLKFCIRTHRFRNSFEPKLLSCYLAVKLGYQ